MYVFCGDEKDFINHFKLYTNNVIDSNYKIIYGNNIAIIRKDDIEVAKLSFTKTQYKVRTFSVPKNIIYSIIIKIDECLADFAHWMNKTLINICSAYSPKEIDGILNDMPLLKTYSSKNENVLRGFSIIWRDHFLEENIGLLNAFVKLGVEPQNILALDKGDNTEHRDEITETFRLLGYKTNVLDNANFNDLQKKSEYKMILKDFLNNREENKTIILDDGAIVTSLIDEELEKKVLFAVELTEMGLRRIKKIKELPCKVYNLAKTDLKKLFTYQEVANTVFLRVITLLGANKLIGRHIVVIGYGDLGSALAEKFRDFGASVYVTDLDYMRLSLAAEKGFTTYESLHDAIINVSPFLIIGTSGYESISVDDLKLLPNDSFITAAATADVTAFKAIEELATVKISNYGIIYIIQDKKLTLLGNGRSINLFGSEAIPNQANDLFKAATLVVLINGIKSNNNKILELNQVNQWIDQSEIFKHYYRLYFKQKG